MNRDLLRTLGSWVVITVTAWFLALTLVAYPLNDINPFHWSIKIRFTHLLIQLALIVAYAAWHTMTEQGKRR